MNFFSIRSILLFLTTILLLGAFACQRTTNKNNVETQPAAQEDPAKYLLGIRIDTLLLEDGNIKNGWSLSVILQKFGVSPYLIDQTAKIAKPVFDVRKIQAGHQYIAMRTMDSIPCLKYLLYKKSPTDYVVFDYADSIRVYNAQKEIVTRLQYAEGSIDNSLWGSMHDKGYNINLSLDLSDIYAWQIDFFGLQKGDRYQVLYDEYFIDDSVSVGTGEIHAALFHHINKDYYAIPFEQDGYRDYFDENGVNLRRAFLKAPLRYSRISSKFNPSRMHPVLRIRRPHMGVDYAAPAGTPVVSIGAGIVIEKGYQRNGGGNYLKIKHNGTYTTTYMHLNGFAKGLQKGNKVSQGEVIGYVGSTGLSTGSHLDFRVFKNGSPIDPLKMESPPSVSLKAAYQDSFEVIKNKAMAQLMQVDDLTVLSSYTTDFHSN